MYERTRNFLLRFLKVPLEPHPPLGDPASLRIFRAGRNYFRLRVYLWAGAQLLALAGIIFWVVVFIQVEDLVQQQRARARAKPAAVAPATSNPPVAATPTDGKAAAPVAPPVSRVAEFKKSFKEALNASKKQPAASGWAGFKQGLALFASLLPEWTFPLIWFLKIFGFAIYLVQIPVTYAVRRLEFETHWYIVTDRSLRLRTGVWKVQELTMSFANLQQVVVTQGPLQRLLGLGDVRVQSAGGAGAEYTREAQENSLHSGYFHSVDNATEIRDLILARLRHFRESGLGDPEESRHLRPAPSSTPGAPAAGSAAADSGMLAAARELSAEARALRLALG